MVARKILPLSAKATGNSSRPRCTASQVVPRLGSDVSNEPLRHPSGDAQLGRDTGGLGPAQPVDTGSDIGRPVGEALGRLREAGAARRPAVRVALVVVPVAPTSELDFGRAQLAKDEALADAADLDGDLTSRPALGEVAVAEEPPGAAEAGGGGMSVEPEPSAGVVAAAVGAIAGRIHTPHA